MSTIAGFELCTIPQQARWDERTEPAHPPVLSHYLSHCTCKAEFVRAHSTLELIEGLSVHGLVELQDEETTCPQSGEQGN